MESGGSWPPDSQEVGFFPSWCPILLPDSQWASQWAPKATPRQGTGQDGRRAAHSQRVPGYYEVILFLSILGKNSKYKIIKVKIHHLDFVVVLRTVLPTVQFLI